MEDIEYAIQHEHFERCIHLRDILQQIDQWTEKQHVVFAPEYEGTVVHVTSLQSFWIIIIVKIFGGKITDVIRTKKKKDEWSINQIQSSLELDFGEELLEQQASQDGSVYYTTSSLKTLKKSDRK